MTEEQTGITVIEAKAVDGELVEETAIIPSSPDALNMMEMLEQPLKVQARTIARGIELMDTMAVTTFAADLQGGLSATTDPMLAQVQNRTAGNIGTLLTSLMEDTDSLDASWLMREPSKPEGFMGRFKEKIDWVQQYIQSFESVKTSIDRTKHELEGELRTLARDIGNLDQLYHDNLAYYHKLCLYIAAGEYKIQMERRRLEALKRTAESSSKPEDAQAVLDLDQAITRLERRVYDLKLTAIIAMQTGPQIRMVQASDQAIAEKIQQSIMTTIPLWKQQAVIAIAIFNQREAARLQGAVAKRTNTLLQQNATLMRQSVTEVQEEVERGFVEIKTLQETQKQLIGTITDVLAIQEKGRQARAEGEKVMGQLTTEMTTQLTTAEQRQVTG